MENIIAKLEKLLSELNFCAHAYLSSEEEDLHFDDEGNEHRGLVYVYKINNLYLSEFKNELLQTYTELKKYGFSADINLELLEKGLKLAKDALSAFVIVDDKVKGYINEKFTCTYGEGVNKDSFINGISFSEEIRAAAILQVYNYTKQFISEFDLLLEKSEFIPIVKQTLSAGKIKWNGSPAHLALLFHELYNKGYIDIPSTRGEASYSKVADICMSIFDVDGSEASIKKAFTPTRIDQMSDTTKAKLSLPPLSEIK